MKVLIVVPTAGTREVSAGHLARCLQSWGIQTEVGVSSVIQSKGGKSYVNSNFDCAIYIEYRKADNTGTTGNEPYGWVPYSSGDKPIFYLGGQVRTGVPSDFPIKAFVLADSTTYYVYRSGLYVSDETAKKVGTCVRRKDGKGLPLWGKFVNYLHPSTPTDYSLYRVDPSKLDANREVLWVLDGTRMGISPPDDHAVVVRYYNRYFLPMSGYNVDLSGSSPWSTYSVVGRVLPLPLLLWCMSREGLKPSRKAPVFAEIDHPINTGGYVAYTEPQKQKLTLTTYEWMKEFLERTGAYVVLGLTTHYTRDTSWGHKTAMSLYPDAAYANEILRLLEFEGLVGACWHDHSANLGATGFSYTRHSGGLWGTPNNVTSPECNFGTGSTATMYLRSEVPLRVHVEDQELQVADLGFRSAWTGSHRHLNFAGNIHGGWQVVALLSRIWGLRSFRIWSTSHKHNPAQGGTVPELFYLRDTQKIRIVDAVAVPSEDLNITATRGLYNPGGGGGSDTDLNTVYGYGASSFIEAYQSHMGRIGHKIANFAAQGGCVYLHDFSFKAALLDDPLAPGYSRDNWNGLKEMLEAMEMLVYNLPDWYCWGTPSDMQKFTYALQIERGFDHLTM